MRRYYSPDAEPGGGPGDATTQTPSATGQQTGRETDQANARWAAMRKENSELQAELKKIRDKQEADERERMEKQGEYKELLAKQDAELAELRPYKERLTTYETARREQILNGFEEADREQFADWPLDKLEPVAARLAKSAPLKPTPTGGKPGDTTAGKPLTMPEIMKLPQHQRAAALETLAASYRK